VRTGEFGGLDLIRGAWTAQIRVFFDALGSRWHIVDIGSVFDDLPASCKFWSSGSESWFLFKRARTSLPCHCCMCSVGGTRLFPF
jgi:hypothetical protein